MKGVRHAVEGIEALLTATAEGVDVNESAIDEFKKQQENANVEKATETGD
jgi:hypothetical protein